MLAEMVGSFVTSEFIINLDARLNERMKVVPTFILRLEILMIPRTGLVIVAIEIVCRTL